MSDPVDDPVPVTAVKPEPAVNPARNGTTARIAVMVTFGLMGLFALFLILDTVQFALVGHESDSFSALTRGIGGLGIGSLLITLANSWFRRG